RDRRRHLLAGGAARRVRQVERRPARADGGADADRRVLELQAAGVGGAMAMDPRWLISRRALLGGLGATSLAALLPRGRARAQSASAPRLVIFHVPEGMWSGAPRPSAGGTDLGKIFEALQPYQSQILLLNNLSMKSRDHGPGGDGHHRGVPH